LKNTNQKERFPFFEGYLLVSFLIMAPSALLWMKPQWEIKGRIYDFWIGQVSCPGIDPEAFRLMGNVLHGVMLLVAGILFLLSFKQLQRQQESGKKIQWNWRIAAVIAVYSLGIPWFSLDCYYYIGKGWQEFHYGADAYQKAMQEMPDYEKDPFFYNVHPSLQCQTGNYGPYHQWFMKGIVALSGENMKGAFIVLRIACILLLLLSAWIVFRLAKDFKMDPELSIYFFICNPIMVFNIVTALHNESGMNLAVLLAVFGCIRNKPILAGAALGFAVAWKFLPLLFLPPMMLYFRDQSRGSWFPSIRLIISFGVVVGLAYCIYPTAFGYSREVFVLGVVNERASLLFLLHSLANFFVESVHGFMLVKSGLNIVFVALCAFLLFPYWFKKRVMSGENLIFVCFLIYLLYLLVAASMVEEWFMTWLISLGVFLKESGPKKLSLYLAVFYMPWVVFMRNHPDSWMIVSQIGSYFLFLGLSLRLVFIPLIRSREFRNQMLGAEK